MNDDRLRVLLHAPDAESLARARSNAQNLRAAEPEAEIEIVVNAGAVAAALEAPHATDSYLRLCENTLARQQRIAPDHLVRVPAAVAHLARRQREGWVYIRA